MSRLGVEVSNFSDCAIEKEWEKCEGCMTYGKHHISLEFQVCLCFSHFHLLLMEN